MVDLGAPGPARARLDEMQVSEPKRVERLDRMAVERHRLRLAGAVGDAVGRQPHANAVGAPDLDRHLRDLQQESRTVLDRTAISVGAQIGARLQKKCSIR